MECDDTTYCYSTDRDCGAGTCTERPKSNSGWTGGLYCGCDGKVYTSYTGAWKKGVDYGSNAVCSQKYPGTMWPCGPVLLCGCKPNENCVAGEQVNDWIGECVNEGGRDFCFGTDFDIHGCDDPKNEFIAVCNECFDTHCEDVTYKNYSCMTTPQGGLYVNCW